MNTKTILSKLPRRAAWLGVPVLLVAGLALPAAAHSAPLAVLVAGLDVSVILEAPPPPRHEVIIERDRPSHDHVWIAGYWGYRHGQREWVAGHWELPPHGRNVWVEPRWEKRDRGYVFIEGYWAEPHHDDHHDHH